MGIYSRYKKDPDGFRKLVELLETTAPSKREKMIEAGMDEDRHYTERALEYMITFTDLNSLSDMELAELVSRVPGRTLFLALQASDPTMKSRFEKNMPNKVAIEYHEHEDAKPSNIEISGARVKLIIATRELERLGKIKLKAIPTHLE